MTPIPVKDIFDYIEEMNAKRGVCCSNPHFCMEIQRAPFSTITASADCSKFFVEAVVVVSAADLDAYRNSKIPVDSPETQA